MLLFVDASRGASYDLQCCFIGDDGCDDEVLIPLEMLVPDRLPYEVYEKTIVVAVLRRIAPSGTWGGYAVLPIYQPLSPSPSSEQGTRSGLCSTRRCAAGSTPPWRRQAVYTMDAAGRVKCTTTDIDLFVWKAEATCEARDDHLPR